MAPLDFEMAQILHENINENDVSLYLGDGVTSFERTGEKIIVTLASQKNNNGRLCYFIHWSKTK